MSKNVLRQSQLLSTFGPGAMLDLPDRSVLVAGLEHWDSRDDASTPIDEPRLRRLLDQRLKEQGRFPDHKVLSLRTPPMDNLPNRRTEPTVQTRVFPTWFLCEVEEDAGTGRRLVSETGEGESANRRRRRRMVRWEELDPPMRRKYRREQDGKPLEVTPIRFVGACKKGHLQDLEWRKLLHADGHSCRQTMWLEDRGSSSDARDTQIVCDCGEHLSLDKLFAYGRLGRCRGNRPWLDNSDPDGCAEQLRLLTRTATNTYFSQVATVISIPSQEDELTRRIEEHIADLARITTVDRLAMLRDVQDWAASAFDGYSDQEVFDRLQEVRQRTSDPNQEVINPKREEFDLLASRRRTIGSPRRHSQLYAETMARSEWASEETRATRAIANLVKVHRLRAVSCLYGFTRFEPAPPAEEDELEDVRLAVEGAPLTEEESWLPALEQFGEGLFVHFDRRAIQQWTAREATSSRAELLQAGFEHWKRFHENAEVVRRGAVYTMLHSLSHALMAQISLQAGYPVSALKERIYALRSGGETGPVDDCAILIYTAAPGTQGTLGGLVDAAGSFTDVLTRALDGLTLCSGDPICADHEPTLSHDDRALHGAACHSCLLIAEPSCENQNRFLDRSLLVETMRVDDAGLFSDTDV